MPPDDAKLPTVWRSPFRRPTMLEHIAKDGGIEIMPPEPRRPAPLHPLPILERHGLPLPVRRFLDINHAAEYVGVCVSTFREEVEAGMWPAPVRRGKSGRAIRWDVRALDAAADRMAGIAQATVATSPPTDDGKKAAEAAAMARFK